MSIIALTLGSLLLAAVDATPDVPAGAAAARDAELSKKAASIIDAFINIEPSFTRDGRQVMFISSRDGLPQPYLADVAKPEAPARRLLATTERVTNLRATVDGKAAVFLSDQGADENWVIHRVGLDGKGLVALTPGEKLNRDPPVLPEGTPRTMFFSARKMSEPASTVYSAPLDAPGPAKVVYRDAGPGFLADVTRDGKQGLFIRFPSESENHAVVVDMATGAARAVYPASGLVTIHTATFTPDGKRILIATDGGAEQSLLLALETRSGKEVGRYLETDPATSQITGLSVSRRGDTVALQVNAGNRTELRLLDARTLKPRARVQMPLGLGGIGEVSTDGKRLPVSWSTPQSPADLYTVDVATGKAAALRKEPRPSIDGLPGVESSIVEVKSFDGTKIPTNVYLPAGAPAKKSPVIVSYHGGPSGSSSIRWSPLSRFFLAQGYVWVEPNVRGSGGFGRAYEAADNGAKRLDAFRDIEAAGRWAAAQPWADPSRMVVMGGSYGGYTVLVALTRQADLWRAGVDLFGIASLKTFMATTSGLIRQIFLVEFGDPAKDGPFLDSISPLADAARIVDPLFVYAGANDPRVPRSESDLIVKALRGRQVPVEYMVASNEGHSLARRDNQIAFYARAARFLETHLK